MSVITIVGGQWGDEGKGKIIDLLAEKVNVVIRFSGGDNAGHTVINPHGEFKLHLVPAGIFYPKVTCIIGNGVSINPPVLLQEIAELKQKGINTDNLFISNRANVIMPYHLLLDRLEEERRGRSAIGTTLKGIGPVFTDKTARLGIRTCDLLNKETLKARLSTIIEFKNTIITKVYNAEPLSFNEVYEQYCDYGEQLKPYIKETNSIIYNMLCQKEAIMLEGAQGTMLDPDFGTYPYVTSSSPLSANSALGSGIPPNKIDNILGIFKAYTTRVGGGPMPTELPDDIGNLIRNIANEYGATTGRPRRCGWFDAIVGRFSVMINGFTGIALTRLDVLDSLSAIKICTGYKLKDKIIDYYPSDLSTLEQCQPIYEELPGWQTSTSNSRNLKQLPAPAQRYISRIEELLSCPVDIVSIGAKREETILIKQLV